MKTIKIRGDFKIVITKKETGSNYNIFASVFYKNDKNPIFGGCFIEGREYKFIQEWAEIKVDEYLLAETSSNLLLVMNLNK